MKGSDYYIDKEYYMKKFNSEAVNDFWDLCGRIEEYVEDKGWDLSRKSTGRYVSFKYGHWIVFGVHYNNKDRFSIFFKIEKHMVKNLEISNFERYKGHTHEIRYYIPSSEYLDLHLFDELFEAAYQNITGKK